jgi:hypothetical protein
VGFTIDRPAGLVRVITFAGSAKAKNAVEGARAAVCQVDGARWITFEGTVRVSSDDHDVAVAVRAYAERYRQPKQRTDRVVLHITVDRVMSSARLQA